MNDERPTKAGPLEVEVPVKVASGSIGTDTITSASQWETGQGSLPVESPEAFAEPSEPELPNQDTTAPGWLARFTLWVREAWQIIKENWNG